MYADPFHNSENSNKIVGLYEPDAVSSREISWELSMSSDVIRDAFGFPFSK